MGAINPFTFIYLELPKFNLKEEELKTKVEKWLYFLKYLEEFNELLGILNQPIFRKAFERAKEANLTKEEKNAYEESLKSYRDNINMIDTARREGEKSKALEVAKKMLVKGMSLEDIQDLTGLSK